MYFTQSTQKQHDKCLHESRDQKPAIQRTALCPPPAQPPVALQTVSMATLWPSTSTPPYPLTHTVIQLGGELLDTYSSLPVCSLRRLARGNEPVWIQTVVDSMTVGKLQFCFSPLPGARRERRGASRARSDMDRGRPRKRVRRETKIGEREECWSGTKAMSLPV